MDEKTLFRVAVDCTTCRSPHRTEALVVAEDGHDALDRVKADEDVGELWDEPIQRAILDGEISDERIARKYSGHIVEADYVGDIQ